MAWNCTAAVAREPGEPLVIEEIMVAPPGHQEVRVRIICTTLCHSDVTFWKMKVFIYQSQNLFLPQLLCANCVLFVCDQLVEGLSSCFSKNIWSRGYRVSEKTPSTSFPRVHHSWIPFFFFDDILFFKYFYNITITLTAILMRTACNECTHPPSLVVV